MIALTATVVATVTLMFYKQQDNALLLQHINTLKTENAALRDQVRQFTTTRTDTLQPALAQPTDVKSAPTSSGPASDS